MHRNPIHIRILKIYTLKACTTLVTYCRHMGHSASCRPHLTHVIMCPHSSNTQSTGASMHTLQRKSVSASVSVCVWQVYCVNVSIWDNVEHSTSNYCGQHEEPELKRDSPKYLMSCWSWAIVWQLTLGYVHLEPQVGLNATCCFTGKVFILGDQPSAGGTTLPLPHTLFTSQEKTFANLVFLWQFTRVIHKNQPGIGSQHHSVQCN